MHQHAIAIDAMGGDFAPEQAVLGALLALSENPNIHLVLLGRESEIAPFLNSANYDKKRLSVVNTQTVILPDEQPTVAIKTKKDSSLVVGLSMLKRGEVGAFLSAGNTGALLTGATTIVGRIKGILRPALGALFPNEKSHTLIIDCGANVDAKPEYLLQFATMGAVYMEAVRGVHSPKVGLVNIGAEKGKGNSLTKESFDLLEASSLHFYGNVEAREIPHGLVDVAVCDAFVGNVLLKYSEGFAKSLLGMLKEELLSSPITKFGALLSKPAYKQLQKKFDYTEIGGAPFLGLNGLVVKAHGSSNAKAFKSAIFQCSTFIEKDVVSKIAKEIEQQSQRDQLHQTQSQQEQAQQAQQF